MAILTSADFYTAFGIGGTPSQDAGDCPIFEPGQSVFYLKTAPPPGSNGVNSPKYTIASIGLKFGLDSGATKILDQRLNATTPADQLTPVTGLTPNGFQHDATTGAISGVVGTTTSSPYFYRITNAATSETIIDVHESELTDEAGWEAYIASIAGTTYA